MGGDELRRLTLKWTEHA